MHDMRGNPIKVGDKVKIIGTVTQVGTSDAYCNCSVLIDAPMPPYTDANCSISALNTRQTEVIESVPAQARVESNNHDAA